MPEFCQLKQSQLGRSDRAQTRVTLPGPPTNECIFAAFRGFVGREHELTLLRNALKQAICGGGSFFLLSGGRGSGKTALVNQLVCEARAVGMRVLFSRAAVHQNFDVEPIFAERIVEAGIAHDGSADRLTRIDGTSPLLGRERGATERGVASGTAPALLIFEDINKWDMPSLRSLEQSAINLRNQHALAIATYCDGELHRVPIKRSAFMNLARIGFHLTLRDFDEITTTKLATLLLGDAPSSAASGEIFRATGGNPLLIEQVLQSWLSTAQDFRGRDGFALERLALSLPTRELVLSLLSDLSPASRDLLAVGAVLGHKFRLNLLARTSELAAPEFFGLIDELKHAGWLERESDDTECWRFRHEVVRHVLYHHLPNWRKSVLHQRAADALEVLDRDTSYCVARAIAEHLQAGLSEGAATVECSTGSARFDHGDHAGLKLLIRLGRSQYRAGMIEKATTTLSRAGEIAQRSGDATCLAQVALAYPSGLVPLPGVQNWNAVLLASSALNAGQPLNAEIRARLCARLAAELSHSAQSFQRASELMELADKIVDGGDQAVQVSVRASRDFLLRGADKVDQRIENARGLADLGLLTGERTIAHFAFIATAVAHLQRGELIHANSAWSAALAAAGSTPDASELHSIQLYRASRAFNEGRLDEAQALAHESYKIKAEDEGSGEFADVLRALVRREQSAFAEASEAVRRAVERRPDVVAYSGLQALIELDFGRQREPRFRFELLSSAQRSLPPHDGMYLAGCALLAELAVELNDLRRARELYAMMIPYSSHFVVVGHGVVLGPVSLYLGILATFLGYAELARQHLEEAIQMSRRTSLRSCNAYAHYYLGRSLLIAEQSGLRLESNQYLEEALAEAQPLGMTRLASKVRLLCAGKATALMTDSKPDNQEQFSGEVRNMAITSVTAEGDTLQFREEGDTSLFIFQRRSVRLKMSKGLKLIMTLLNEPDRDFHVLDLERFRNGDECAGQYVRAADGEPQLDAQAKRSYRARLHELREHLDEARSFNDSHRASLLEEEIAFLARELARAVGLRGSDRKTFSDAERARARATQAIRSAIRKIAKHDNALGWYLDKTIITGSFCCYRPGPARTV